MTEHEWDDIKDAIGESQFPIILLLVIVFILLVIVKFFKG